MNESKKLKRGLKSRHVTMIAIGGSLVQAYSKGQVRSFTVPAPRLFCRI